MINPPKLRGRQISPSDVVVSTGARLHFGLLDTAAPFGGVGVMVEQPVTTVALQRAEGFQCEGCAVRRVEAIVQRLRRRLDCNSEFGVSINVAGQPPAHSGFGSGTQLSLAIAEGLCELIGYRPGWTQLWRDLAARGKRSAVGIHGYAFGGLIYESPSGDGGLNPVQQRIELPQAWSVGMFIPRGTLDLVSGDAESRIFAQLPPATPQQRSALQDVLHDQLLASAASADFEGFASAVTRYNRLSGLLFKKVQGGPYNGPAVSRLVHSLEQLGAKGVGQSSWGPGVFAWFRSRAEAEQFVQKIPEGVCHAQVTQVRNRPRIVSHEVKTSSDQRLQTISADSFEATD